MIAIPDFCLACGRQYVPLVPESVTPLADRFAEEVSRESNMPSRYVVAGVLWCLAVAAVAAGLVAAAAWAVG